MANRCETKVTLYGNDNKIIEVINYLKETLHNESDHYKGFFLSKAFSLTNSWCSIKGLNTFDILSLWDFPSKEINELSKKFPEVGFRSDIYNDIGSIEEEFRIKGSLIFCQYLELEGPEYWERITGFKVVNSFWHLDNKEDWYHSNDNIMSDLLRDDYYL